MFSLCELMDAKKDYQKACMEIVHRRAKAMIEGMGLQLPPNPNFDAYYGLIDFEFWARKNIGDDAVEYLKKNVHPLDLAFRLAEDHGIVLLNGGGFEAPDWSLRVSLGESARRGIRRHWPRRSDHCARLPGRVRSFTKRHLGSERQIGRAQRLIRRVNRWRGYSMSSRTRPEIFIFLAVAIGTVLGRIRIRGFAFGATACTLVVAVILGQLGGFVFPALLKSILFGLFVFTIGYRSGPEFFASLSFQDARAGRVGAGHRCVSGSRPSLHLLICCISIRAQRPGLPPAV